MKGLHGRKGGRFSSTGSGATVGPRSFNVWLVASSRGTQVVDLGPVLPGSSIGECAAEVRDELLLSVVDPGLTARSWTGDEAAVSCEGGICVS